MKSQNITHVIWKDSRSRLSFGFLALVPVFVACDDIVRIVSGEVVLLMLGVCVLGSSCWNFWKVRGTSSFFPFSIRRGVCKMKVILVPYLHLQSSVFAVTFSQNNTEQQEVVLNFDR
jgi:hypothetical protein